MGEYEPDDSRDVTQNPAKVPIAPEPTGPREGETRRPANQTEPEPGSVPQRNGHQPRQTDLARGSEPATRGSSGNRT